MNEDSRMWPTDPAVRLGGGLVLRRSPSARGQIRREVLLSATRSCGEKTLFRDLRNIKVENR